MSATSPRYFVLPDLCSLCPFEPSTNPHYASAAAASSAWINAYNVFTDRKRAAFIQGYNELLVSHTYPYADYEQFRTCCDFVNLLFVVDEVSDEQNGADARSTGEIFLNVMRDPTWDDGSALAKMTREFRDRLQQFAGPGCMRRFLKHCENYIDAVAKEAEYRERGVVLDVTSFETLRRENSAIRLCFGLFEFCFGVDLPDEVFDDPTFMALYWAAADMVCWSNDVYSYNMEQAKGIGGNNIVTVLMHDKGVDLQTASNLVGDRFKSDMARFVEAKRRLPSWDPAVDQTVRKYVKAMEHWIVGNLEWSFETQRYFGPLHAEIKKTRVVHVRPREEDR
ncbi:isoprenoid synthase domain-containing protein [Fomitopsis serialis]|uniref:isoprenoid synthase domain-containing protein n=1 Tax=Fomitopsis serialis TaxID=139415 RepID=UPI002008CEB4|nr:isoprenoid synthase domain-containing protein [Neoantrodia serialis]KAH9928682.1 isoprenoid synthase domain-containing protein [Neoantrodia serialis]